MYGLRRLPRTSLLRSQKVENCLEEWEGDIPEMGMVILWTGRTTCNEFQIRDRWIGYIVSCTRTKCFPLPYGFPRPRSIQACFCTIQLLYLPLTLPAPVLKRPSPPKNEPFNHRTTPVEKPQTSNSIINQGSKFVKNRPVYSSVSNVSIKQ